MSPVPHLNIVLLLAVFIYSSIGFSQSLYLAENSIIHISSGTELCLLGDLESNGVNNITGEGSLSFNGSSIQQISGGNLSVPATIITNVHGVTTSSNLIVNGQLTLGSNILHVSANKTVNVLTNSISRTTGFIDGVLQKTINSGASTKVFEVGNGTKFMPVTIGYSSVISSPFSVSVSSNSNPVSPIPTTLSQTKVYNGYWTVTASSGAPSQYSFSASISPSQLLNGAQASNLVSVVNSNISNPASGTWNGVTPKSGFSSNIIDFNLSSYGLVQLGESGSIQLTLKVFPESFYFGSSLVPNLLFSGIDTSTTLSDTIFVQLRETVAPFNLVAQQSVLLSINGLTSIDFTGIQPDTFYLVCKHRNHIPIWSALPIVFSTSTNYDFSSTDANTFGSNVKQISTGVYAMLPGDINQDGVVNADDQLLLEIANANFDSGYVTADLNGDGIVNADDQLILEISNSNFSSEAQPF